MDWASLTDDQKFTATIALLSASGGAVAGGLFSLVASLVVFFGYQAIGSEYQATAAEFFHERGFPGIKLDISESSN